MDTMRTEELISALADGQLAGDAFARGVELAAADPVARQAWHTYHLIGDVLRSGEHAAGALPAEFLGRLQARLQQEQVPAPGARQRGIGRLVARAGASGRERRQLSLEAGSGLRIPGRGGGDRLDGGGWPGGQARAGAAGRRARPARCWPKRSAA